MRAPQRNLGVGAGGAHREACIHAFLANGDTQGRGGAASREAHHSRAQDALWVLLCLSREAPAEAVQMCLTKTPGRPTLACFLELLTCTICHSSSSV